MTFWHLGSRLEKRLASNLKIDLGMIIIYFLAIKCPSYFVFTRCTGLLVSRRDKGISTLSLLPGGDLVPYMRRIRVQTPPEHLSMHPFWVVHAVGPLGLFE